LNVFNNEKIFYLKAIWNWLIEIFRNGKQNWMLFSQINVAHVSTYKCKIEYKIDNSVS